MTPDEARADQIRARADAATPGPWELGKAYHLNVVTEQGKIVARVNNRVSETVTDAIAESMNAANRDFIAAARSDVPWLLDRLAAATAEVEDLRFQIAVAEWPDEKRDHILDLMRQSRFEDLWQEAEARLAAATERADRSRQALVGTGYFTDDEIGPDVAPRIIELDEARRRETAELRARIEAVAQSLAVDEQAVLKVAAAQQILIDAGLAGSGETEAG